MPSLCYSTHGVALIDSVIYLEADRVQLLKMQIRKRKFFVYSSSFKFLSQDCQTQPQE